MDPRCADRGGHVSVQPEPRSGGGAIPERAAAALAAAEIPPSKLGAARRARLTESERELYFWILRQFATAGRPSSVDIHEAAEWLAIDAEQALETLAGEDLVHRGSDGEVTVAYPFAGRPTAHRVRFPGGHEVDAMCAIDALGIAPMFGEQVAVDSRDPLSGDPIRARVAPDGAAEGGRSRQSSSPAPSAARATRAAAAAQC